MANQIIDDSVLSMDWDILDACNGFSFDMGGSVFKIVYIAKDDWVEPSKRKPGSKGNVHIKNITRENLEEGLNFIRENVRIKRENDSEVVEIYCTGYGADQYKHEFKEKLNVKNIVLPEFDCSNHGFNYLLKNSSRDNLLHPVYRQGFEMSLKESEGQLKALQQTKTTSYKTTAKWEDIYFPQLNEKDSKWPIDEEELFPCAVMTCGSGFGFCSIQADGTSKLIDGSYRGGKMFLGLGSILTGAKGYDELMGLCMKGKARNVSITQKDVMDSVKSKPDTEIEEDGDNKSFYEAFADREDEGPDSVLFPYGKGLGKTIDDFKKEDLARCLLETHCLDLVQVTHYIARLEKVKHVFFSGGFVTHELVRQTVTTEWARRELVTKIFADNKDPVQVHFLRNGASSGAIAALMNHKLHWSDAKQ